MPGKFSSSWSEDGSTFSQNFSFDGDFIQGDVVEGDLYESNQNRVDYSNATDFDVEFDIAADDQKPKSKPKQNKTFTVKGDFIQGDKFEFNNFDF